MVPRGEAAPRCVPSADPGMPVLAQDAPQVLTIRFVRLDGGRVSGSLDPYRAPACGCTVYSILEGMLDGDRLAGTFATRGAPPGEVTGTWHAQRRGR